MTRRLMNTLGCESRLITTIIKQKKTLGLLTLIWLISLFFFGWPSSWKENISSMYKHSLLLSGYDGNNNRSEQSSNIRFLAAALDFTDNPKSHIGIFIVIDSTKLGSNAELETVVKWPELNAVLTECKDTPELKAYRFYLVFYEDDIKFSTIKFQTDLIAYFNSTLGLNSSASVQLTSAGENRVEFLVRKLTDRKQDSLQLNDIIRDAYLKNVNYFYVIRSNEFVPAVARERKDLKQMRDTLVHDSEFSNVGVVVQASKDDTIIGIFFSKIHIEIFGETFPYDIATVSRSLDFLTGVYPRNLTRIFYEGDSQVQFTLVNSSVDFNASRDIVERERVTLKRYLDAIAASPHRCLRCDISNSHNIIAMSLYGSGNRYTMGAIRNAQLLPVIFPKWRLWFYCEIVAKDRPSKFGSIPDEIVAKLLELGAEIRYIDPVTTGLAPMLWRFLAAADSDVEIFTVRDSDSRLTAREAAVVSDWLKTDKAFHCIRDHPSHSNYAVSGGLWGGRRASMEKVMNGNIATVMKKYGAGYVEDMNFLGADVWPMVKDNHSFCHDSFSCEKFPSSHPFPVKREGFEHLGQVYDEHSIGRAGDINILRAHGVNAKCVPP